MTTTATAGTSGGPAIDGPEFGETPARFPASGAASPETSGPQAAVWTADYTLTSRDMTIWLAHTRAERRAARGLYASAVLGGIMGLQFLTGRLPVPAGRAFAVAEVAIILILPILLAYGVRRRNLAAHAQDLLPAAVKVRLERWPDRLVETRDDGKPVLIRPRLLSSLVVTRSHILGETETARLIVPRSAFETAQAMRDFGAELQRQRG